MINLNWSGRMVGDLLGDRRILPIYMMSAILGAVFYFIQARLFPTTPDVSLGASAATLGLVISAAMISPESLFFGPLKVKHIALIFVVADLIFVFASNRDGAAFNAMPLARLGGALMGFLYISQLRNGTELGRPIINFYNKFFASKTMKNWGGGYKCAQNAKKRRTTKQIRPDFG
jgi:membrane associated rhomboid family serine protease